MIITSKYVAMKQAMRLRIPLFVLILVALKPSQISSLSIQVSLRLSRCQGTHGRTVKPCNTVAPSFKGNEVLFRQVFSTFHCCPMSNVHDVSLEVPCSTVLKNMKLNLIRIVDAQKTWITKRFLSMLQ